MRRVPVWDADEVDARTKGLEQEVARRLVDEGVDLILERDKFSPFDGYTERNGRRISVCEVKTRTEPLSYFEEKGSFLFDASKLSKLLRIAEIERLKAVLFVMTGDERLFFHSLKRMPKSEKIQARKNHHSREYIEKRVCLIPLEEFTEIVPKVHEVRPGDIQFYAPRNHGTIEHRYPSKEIMGYYHERKAVLLEQGMSDLDATAQADRETRDWVHSRWDESTMRILKR